MKKRNGNAAILFSMVLTLAVVLAIWPAAQALARGPGGGGGPGMGMGGGRGMGSGGPGCAFGGGAGGGGFGLHGMMRGLDLSADQKQQIALIFKEHRDDAKQTIGNMAAAREKLFSAVHGAQYNEAAVRQAAQDVARLQEEMAVMRAQVVSKVQNVLTPEQKEKLAAGRADMRSRMQDRMEARFDRMDGWINRHAQ
jgi:Spy/CpxP family protein refolding chaperone